MRDLPLIEFIHLREKKNRFVRRIKISLGKDQLDAVTCVTDQKGDERLGTNCQSVLFIETRTLSSRITNRKYKLLAEENQTKKERNKERDKSNQIGWMRN
ncbi:hypothetical protein BpHYR1_011209 [Brachionus plicatilis]|uniref:Uncharacterized protein n=1 Tax=Brachionus plicatilis TaxID=10195 RepID=A0A3M7SNF2_BRAPC|nr:hypothetical protein BpHYR1_011209 [Brachionus plicatilis]